MKALKFVKIQFFRKAFALDRFICCIKIIQNKETSFCKAYFLHKMYAVYRFEKGVFMEKSYWENPVSIASES